MIGRTIQWEGCATHLELELCCMDVFSVIVRQYCTAVSGDSRHHHDRNIEAKKRHFEKKKNLKSPQFSKVSSHGIGPLHQDQVRKHTRHIQTHTNGTERPAEGPHIPFSGQFDLCQGRWTLGTGGILGKNTQLELSDYAVGRERGQTSQRKKLVPGSKNKKICWCSQWDSIPVTVVTTQTSPTSNPAPCVRSDQSEDSEEARLSHAPRIRAGMGSGHREIII